MEHQYKLGALGVLLFLDLSGVAPYNNYQTVVCLQEVTPKDTRAVIDASSACGPAKQLGQLDLSAGFKGIHLLDPATGKVSGSSIRVALRNNITVGFKIAPQYPEIGDEIETGTGGFSELSSTYSFNAATSFTGTIQPDGETNLTTYEGS